MGEDRCTMFIVDLQKHKVQVEFEQRTSAHLKRFFGDCGEEEDYPVSCWDGNWKAVLWGGGHQIRTSEPSQGLSTR